MTGIEKGIYNRSELLLGSEMMDVLASKRVIIFGVGGVGSWCAESLIRNGIRQLTIVDSDRVCITNCNRQLMATTKTIGQVKVEALKQRLLEINPSAEITALQKIYEKETADSFHLEQYDYVIDAIDSLKDKIQLIMHATNIPSVTFFSSMGAALRVDPTKVKTAEFWKVRNDTLGAALRKRMRQKKLKPGKKFLCVYSEELPMENKGTSHSCGTAACMCPKAKLISGERGTDTAIYDAPGDQKLVEHEWCTKKAQINGSLSHITGLFGLTLSGLVMSDILNKQQENKAENI